jgi:HAD superfamily hydrolase (TIGR01509 family)
MIRALLFDFDGTILDTETCEYEAWRAVFQFYDLELTLAEWAPGFHGASGVFDPYLELETRLGHPVARRTVRHRYQLKESECIARQSLRPGIAEYLAGAERLGLRAAVVSSEFRSWIVGHLERFNLGSRFDVVCCADDTDRLKPLPDLYLLALTRLGLSAGEAIALEDSPNGIRAAQSAGVFCVAIPNPVTRLLELGHADLVVSSLGDLPLDQLIQRSKGNHHAT